MVTCSLNFFLQLATVWTTHFIRPFSPILPVKSCSINLRKSDRAEEVRVLQQPECGTTFYKYILWVMQFPSQIRSINPHKPSCSGVRHFLLFPFHNTTHCMQSCGIPSDSIIEESEEGALINVISSTGMYSMTALSILTRIQYKISFANNLPPFQWTFPCIWQWRQHEQNKMDVKDVAGVSISDCKLVLVMWIWVFKHLTVLIDHNLLLSLSWVVLRKSSS